MKFGVETGSPRMLKTLGKPVDLEKVQRLVGWCRRHRIKTHATFAVGLWGDDRQSVAETLDFMARLDSDSIQVSICTPFPGTAFFQEAQKAGYLKTTDWEKYDGKTSEVVSNPNFDLEEVERLRSIALRRWLVRRLLSPAWLQAQVYYLLRLWGGLGIGFLLRQAVALIAEERRFLRWKR